MNEEEQLDENEPIDPNDPEKGLDKFVERNQKRRQKEYEENKYRNRELQKRQEGEQLDIPGMFEAGSGFRTTAAIGTEVGLNTLLDLFSFVPPVQVAGGSAINYLAQRIRGGEFSEGEFIASGLASLIPGAAQARSLGGVIGKTATRGAVSGALETGAADLIDTGEIDPERVAQGTVIGGAFGGLFGTAVGMNPTKVANTVARIKARVRGGDFIPLDSGIIEGVGTVAAAEINPKGTGDPEGLRSLKYQEGDVLANTPAKNVKLLKELNLTDDESVFLLSNYYKEGSVTSTTITRNQAAAIESLYTTVEEFDKTKDLALPYFLRGMKGIQRTKTPQLDHIAQLKASLPFFNNAKVSQFPEITKIILEEGVFGLGHQRGNFKYLEFDVHTVKSNYFEDIVGNNGEIFFKNRDISTPTKLREAAKEYARIIDESNNVVADAIEQYKFMNKTEISQAELDEFVNILSEQPTRRKYSIKQVKKIFEQMEEEGFIQTPTETAKAEAAEIKAEKQAADAQAKTQKQLNKDTASVEQAEAILGKLDKNIEKFVNPYPFRMKSEELREAVEKEFEELQEYKLTLGPQQRKLEIFELEDKEAWIKKRMQLYLDKIDAFIRRTKRSKRSKRNKKK